ISLDVRVIAATNADLESLMSDSRFREDLYYRLAVVVIAMPPLQAREGEIPLLARSFLDRYASESRKKITGFAPKALNAMENYSWPGNVRELENRVRRAIIMAEGNQITPADLGFSSGYEKYEGMTLREARKALEKELVQRALSRSQGNVSRAAASLAISRPTLYELIEKLGIER
ncbi:MAG: sigma 54-interacting transcriptional regulator, partial [Acidobacteriota bacterium]